MAAATAVRVWSENQSDSQLGTGGRAKGAAGSKGGSREKPTVPGKPILPPVGNGLLTVPQGQDPCRERSVSPFPMSLGPHVQERVASVFSFDGVACKRRIEEVWPRRCAYIVMEIIHTEKTYIQALADVIKVGLSVSFSVYIVWLLGHSKGVSRGSPSEPELGSA